MAKAKKQNFTQPMIPSTAEGVPSFQLEISNRRDVSTKESEDRWCYRPKFSNGETYIYAIPLSLIKDKLNIYGDKGFIVRAIKSKDELLIQFMPKEWRTGKRCYFPKYGICKKERLTTKGVFHYFFNIRNLHKKMVSKTSTANDREYQLQCSFGFHELEGSRIRIVWKYKG